MSYPFARCPRSTQPPYCACTRMRTSSFCLARVLSWKNLAENCFIKFREYLCVFGSIFGYIKRITVMSSPAKRRGSCGHMMAGFDNHKKCAWCRDKGVGDDPCLKQETCSFCDSFTDVQRSMLSTTQYQIRREKKAGLLVSPSKVTIVGPVEESSQDYTEQEVAHAT